MNKNFLNIINALFLYPIVHSNGVEPSILQDPSKKINVKLGVEDNKGNPCHRYGLLHVTNQFLYYAVTSHLRSRLNNVSVCCLIKIGVFPLEASSWRLPAGKRQFGHP